MTFLQALACAMLLSLAVFVPMGPALSNPLEDYAWKKRAIVIYAPADAAPLLAQQRANLAAHKAALEERDIVLIEVSPDKVRFVSGPPLVVTAADLMTHAGFHSNRFGIVLIGKDTGVKLRSSKPVGARELFELVDAMPMRQREMSN